MIIKVNEAALTIDYCVWVFDESPGQRENVMIAKVHGASRAEVERRERRVRDFLRTDYT